MKIIRKNVFETNSSSTHSLIYGNQENSNYLAPNSKLVVSFIDTDDEKYLTTLKEKVSYLVSQIVNKYKDGAVSYEDLIQDVEEDYDYKRIKDYVKEHFNKELAFPQNYRGDVSYIVNINHQLQWWGSLDELLQDLCRYNHDYLDDVLASTNIIEIGHD